jgi:uncharacterized protein
VAISPLSNLFGKSPFGPLQKHMESVQACTAELPAFIDAAIAGDWDAAATQQQKIVDMEVAADKLKKSLRLNLPKSLFLPVPRGDVLELLRTQDHIANCARDIAGLILGRKMTPPEALLDQFRNFVNHSVEASTLALKAIEELDELLETGFRGPDAEFVEKLIEQLDTFEHENDKLKADLNSALFAIEKDLNPVDVMFLYKLISWVGDLADNAQKVGSRLQIVIAR